MFKKICPVCGKEFEAKTSRKVFCGNKCRKKRYRETHKEEIKEQSKRYRETHKEEIKAKKQDETYRKKEAERMRRKRAEGLKVNDIQECEERYKKQFEEYFKEYEYIKGYTHSDSIIFIRHKKCGHVFTINAQMLRKYKRLQKENIECPRCKEMYKEVRVYIENKLNIISENKKELEKRKNIVKDIKLKVDKKKRICKVCGKTFCSSKGKVCSDICKLELKRMNARKKDYKRRMLMKSNGDMQDISILKLMERDNNTCYLCGNEVDINDYCVDKEGTFIAGNNYPSIEHVIPLSKGGTHTWDNVKLACRHCNSIKSDKII
jgi:hypothetical protein